MNLSDLFILVVDDDVFTQDLLTEMLGSLGITRVQCANNGRSALALLAKQPEPPHAIICDVFMPDMDGIELINALAAQRYSGGLVLLSGMDMQMLSLAKDIAQASEVTVLGAFVKPVATPVLAVALENMLHKK